MDSKGFVSQSYIHEMPLWKRMKEKRQAIAFDLEITARCNNNCRHCYINLPTNDKHAKAKELSFEEIVEIAKEAVSLGAFWCLLTGGEPLLRDDFFDIYLALKKMGLLVSVFTNATLIAKEHVKLFKIHPPRDLEVSVYGVTEETYERVTRSPGSFSAFMRGLEMLLNSGVKVRLKAMALRSNVHELWKIRAFCQQKTKDYWRFDPFLHLRFDGNKTRNEEIKAERLTPKKIVELECKDPERLEALKRRCDTLLVPEFANYVCNHLFHCGAGNSSFSVSYDGIFRLCNPLWHPDCIYDLKKGTLSDAWWNFVPKVRAMRSNSREFLEKCRVCPLINLCMWCPAHAHLETGKLDGWVDYFCEVAHARAEMLKEKTA